MDGPIIGGMLYYEVRELKLCAVHCVNTVLQVRSSPSLILRLASISIGRSADDDPSSGDFARLAVLHGRVAQCLHGR
ncbi:hypothetical protein Syun_005333 [Stephania yunnanensis]|uniref:Uncharacterized protein n=1 Tax=Stephania yunnanensis TaxID=152371 RepID=A0AAP0L510_9MAGN